MKSYTMEDQNGQLIVTLTGDLTAIVVPSLQEPLRSSIASGANSVTFDLAKSVMVDSTGIGLLIAVYNTLNPRRGSVRVINVSEDILKLLHSMRLASRLNVSGRPAEEVARA